MDLKDENISMFMELAKKKIKKMRTAQNLEHLDAPKLWEIPNYPEITEFIQKHDIKEGMDAAEDEKKAKEQKQ